MATEERALTDLERWYRERYAPVPERRASFTTLSGETIRPLYTEGDLPDPDEIGLPGEYPFTRGVYPSMYRGRLWTMRQFAGFGTAEETNERFRYLLDHGQTGLSTAFDMPSLMGHDSDHPRSEGEVGRECVPIDPAMRLVGDMIEFCSRRMPRWHPVSISGYHIREAGSTAQQELAFTLKDGFTYVEQAIERGLDVDDFAPRLSFFFNSHIDFFEEIAKYRAARRIWARELRDTYGARDERSLLMRFHSQTAGVSLTAQQPLNNIVRTATEALTDRMEEAAYAYFQRIDELGGMVDAIKQNYPQREIAEASFRLQEEIERGERIVVGVNRYQQAEEPPLSLLRIPAELERKQIDRVLAIRAGRDAAEAERALSQLREAAASERNLMEPLLDAARVHCTEGEIVGSLQRVFGTYTETPVF